MSGSEDIEKQLSSKSAYSNAPEGGGGSSKGEPGKTSGFVSEAVLRGLVFEDYSRASSWELLLHHLLSSFTPLTATRRRFLAQVNRANSEASAAAAAVARDPNAHSAPDYFCSSRLSRHACLMLPRKCACACSSSTTQQQRGSCTVSLRLFVPLVIENLLSYPQPQQQRLRLTYTCAAPLPDLPCTCRVGGRRGFSKCSGSNSPSAAQALPFAEDHGILKGFIETHLPDSSSSINSSSSKRELRCGTCGACVLRWERLFPSRASFVQRDFGVSEFLFLENVRLPENAATKVAEAVSAGLPIPPDAAAAGVPVRIPKHVASTRLAALSLASRAAQQQESPEQDAAQEQLLLSGLPLFCIHSPQHEACLGSHVFKRRSSISVFESLESFSAATAAAAEETWNPSEAKEPQRRAVADIKDATIPLTIREYESRFLSSAFASDDRNKFLNMLLPHLGVGLGLSQPNHQSQQHQQALRVLQQLCVTAQYTYFLPRPWQQRWTSSSEYISSPAATASREEAPEAWWLQQGHSGSGASSGGSSVSGSTHNSIMDQWREVAREAASLPLDEDANAAPTADGLLSLLLQQPCPFQDLHASCCSPLQSLKDFRSARHNSSSPVAAAFDCRLRFTLEQPLLRLHAKLLDCCNTSSKQHHEGKQTDFLEQLTSVNFLQDDLLRQQCGVTSRIHQLGLLLLACSNSAGEGGSGSDERTRGSVCQQPLHSMSSALLVDADRSFLRQRLKVTQQQQEGSTGSTCLRRGNSNDSLASGSSSNISYESSMQEETPESVEAKVQQLFRPMTRQQQLLIHEQQVKRLLLIGNYSKHCACCTSSCSCCGIDLAFSLLWGGSSCSSFFTDLALLAGEQQRLRQLQEVWQQVLVRLRAVWDRGLLLPRVVSGLTSATVAAAGASLGRTGRLHPASALTAARGISCCPDGPCALPDFCCSPLQQLLQHLNCAVQQQRLQWLQQQLPQEQQQQPFEALRFVMIPHKDLLDLREPMLPILLPVTEGTLSMHETLLRERGHSGAGSHEAFGEYCEGLLVSANSNRYTAKDAAAWWQQCFAGLPRGVDQLLRHRRQLLRQQQAAQTAAGAAVAAAAHPLEAVGQAARSAVAAAATAAPTVMGTTKSRHSEPQPHADQNESFFNCLVEGEVALHGLESLTAADVAGQCVRILVASLVEQCRLACACLFEAKRSSAIRRCLYTPGVAAECLTYRSSVLRRHLSAGKCRGLLFPCHLPAIQAVADDLQRHAIAHAARTTSARGKDNKLAWVPSLALLAACMRCEYLFSAAAALCRVLGTKLPALAIVNRTLDLLLQQLLQQEQVAAAAAATQEGGTDEESRAHKPPEAEFDLLVPLLSCDEKRALQRMLLRYSGDTSSPAAMEESAASPWDITLPWPPFAQEYVFLQLAHKEGAQWQQWRFYCREQHGDRAFATVKERAFQ
ncbi:hypothetical protein Efla_000716 [Eimeria flavescens]